MHYPFRPFNVNEYGVNDKGCFNLQTGDFETNAEERAEHAAGQPPDADDRCGISYPSPKRRNAFDEDCK